MGGIGSGRYSKETQPFRVKRKQELMKRYERKENNNNNKNKDKK